MQKYALSRSGKEEKELRTTCILGYVAHYHLDKGLPPYIECKIKQEKDNGGKNPELYYHSRLEADIDVLMCRHYLSQSIYEFRFFDYHCKDTSYYKPIAKMYQAVLKEILGVSLKEKQMMSSIKTMKVNRHLHKKRLCRLTSSMQKIFRTSGALAAHFKREERAKEVDIHEEREWENAMSGQKSNLSIVGIFENATQSAAAELTIITDAMSRNEVCKINDKLSFMEGLRKLEA